MKRVLKICPDIWKNENRDKRELSVCRELGAETLVMAKGRLGDSFQKDEVDGFPVFRFSTRPLGTARWLTPLNQVLSLFIWGWKARKFRADIISGHDLPGLFIGYLSNFGSRHKAKLVYDSHEFEIGRSMSRNASQTWLVTHLERFLIKRCAFSIMVNDAIADEVQSIHRLKKRPVVARNVPAYWELNPEKIVKTRAELLQKLNLPKEGFLIMYHGGVTQGRGIENLLQAVSKVQDAFAIILGDAEDQNYLASLHSLCQELDIRERVLFLPAVPTEMLRNYVGAVNLGITLPPPKSRNHILSLPNKFFENIQSLTPLIVSRFPSLESITRYYGIGLTVDPENVEEIATAICRMRDDQEFYATCKNNLKRAKENLCWEKERGALTDAYRRILS